MKIAVLGATGRTGSAIVAEAQRRGHEVNALVRTAASGDLAGARLVVGDARDEVMLSLAIEGCDAVISAIGTPVSPFREVTLLSSVTAALVRLMELQTVRRLVCITGMGAGDSRGHGGVMFDRLIMPLLLRKVYADKDRQEAIVRASDRDWVLVRPTVLSDRPPHGKVRALTELTGFNGGTIARKDVANFVVRQLNDNKWLNKTPLITW